MLMILIFRSLTFKYWTCVCGSLIPGHSCTDKLRTANQTISAAEKTRLAGKDRISFEHLQHGGAAMLIGLDAAVC